LLAEVAELRRAVRSAQRSGEEQGGQAGQQGEANPGQGDQAGNGDSRSARLNGESQQGGENNEGQQADGSKGSPGSRQGGTSQSQSSRGGTAGAQSGLTAWNPISPARGLNTLEDGRGSLARQTAVISQRIRDLTNRMTGGELTDSELEALRRHANQLRRLNGDPLADQGEAMLRVIDQIELTALNAAARAKGDTPAHATLPSPESPRYREAVAEYYRRLGNR
jgi:hypothetical protein